MYRYDETDQRLVDERVVRFRDQMRRYLAGELSDDDFRPLRLQNGLYVQRHAPMFRIAVPYGMLASRQLRCLAQLGRQYVSHHSTHSNRPFHEQTAKIQVEPVVRVGETVQLTRPYPLQSRPDM